MLCVLCMQPRNRHHAARCQRACSLLRHDPSIFIACGVRAGIVCPKGAVTRFVFAAGWDRTISCFEDSRAAVVPAARQLPPSRPAHATDILAAALMEDSPNLVTAASGGEMKVLSRVRWHFTGRRTSQ